MPVLAKEKKRTSLKMWLLLLCCREDDDDDDRVVVVVVVVASTRRPHNTPSVRGDEYRRTFSPSTNFSPLTFLGRGEGDGG
jgi:hypothetical protein